MRHFISVVFLSVMFAGCSKPTDIILGPEPLKQMAEQGDQFKKLVEEDRVLLAGYLGLSSLGKAFGGEVKPTAGRTVGEVLVDARAWQEQVNVAAEEAKKREAEAAVLKQKVDAERKVIADKIAGSVLVAVTDKKVLPKNYDVGRYSEMLSISYAVQNKAEKTIRQLKGRVTFFDPTGDEIGWLPVDFDEPIEVGKTLKTTTGRGWKINEFMNGNIEKIAGREFSAMKAGFVPVSIAFEGGEVLKAPQ